MKNSLRCFATAFACGAIFFSANIFAAEKKPNIIFILADDLGYGDVGCYGQKKIKTPNLDRMAEQGMRFTQFYAGCTVCAPSRCTLMTGKHTGHCVVRGNAGKQNRDAQVLPADEITVAKILHDAGYATALIGKWGLGEADTPGVPTRQGFDYFFGYLDQLHAHNYFPAFLWRNETRVPLRNEVPGDGEFGQGFATKKVDYSADLFGAETLKWIEEKKSQPFFLYFATTIPHANNEATRATGNGQEVPDAGIYKNEDWPEPSKSYAAMITLMDKQIGEIFSLLKKLGIDENTLVFFSSDNGPQKEGGNPPAFFNSSGPLRGIKRDLYEGGVRMPTIARWPGKIKAGVTSEQIGAFWDFLPTAAELAGAKSPANIDGVSLVPALLEQKPVAHPPLYFEFHEGGFKQAVRDGDWKAVRNAPKKPIELYDLKNDVGEKNDVASQHADIVAKMESLMKSLRADSPAWPIRETPAKKTNP